MLIRKDVLDFGNKIITNLEKKYHRLRRRRRGSSLELYFFFIKINSVKKAFTIHELATLFSPGDTRIIEVNGVQNPVPSKKAINTMRKRLSRFNQSKEDYIISPLSLLRPLKNYPGKYWIYYDFTRGGRVDREALLEAAKRAHKVVAGYEAIEKLDKEQQVLWDLNMFTPQQFNKLDGHTQLYYLAHIFNQYLEEVAIPKGWGFTQHIRQWPTGEFEGEEIVKPDARPDAKDKDDDEEVYNIIISDEKNKAINEALSYPDFGLFAMRKYRLLIDNDTETNPKQPRLYMKKVTKAEARSFVAKFEKEVLEEENSKSITERLDEKETMDEALRSRLNKIKELSREEGVNVIAYIVMKFAESKGIPVKRRNRDFDTDLEALVKDNQRLLNKVAKYSKELYFFALEEYDVALKIDKEKNLYIRKVPEEARDFVSDYLASKSKGGKEKKKLTDKELNEVKRKVEEIFKKYEKNDENEEEEE